jgi:hypothetical protein
MIFLSICVCSNRPANIAGMMENLDATAADKNGFELLVAVNEGDRAVIDAIDAQRVKVRFSCRIVEVPQREGYYSLHHGYEALRASMDSSSYFVWQISDEIRIKTKGWDEILKRYIRLFPDDLFRLRLSLNKWRNYYCLYECFPYPDNYTVTARAWYDATEGSGEIWGPDSWHQGIDYFLGQLRNPYEPYGKGVFRSIPVHEVELENEAAGQGLDSPQSAKRRQRIKDVYRELCGLVAQEKFLRLALLVNARIWMAGKLREQPQSGPLFLREDTKRRRICVVDAADMELYGASYSILPFLFAAWWRSGRRMVPSLGVLPYLRHEWRRRQSRA